MNTDQPLGAYTIRLAENDDVADMARLLGSVFSRRDPPAVATGFASEKLEQLARIFGAKSVAESLSVIACSRETGEMAGVLLAHDFANPPPDEIAQIDLDTEPVIALLDGLEERFQATHKIAPGRILHVFMIAVRDACANQGLAQSLARACMENARTRGYGIAFTEATNKTSQRVFRKSGFTETHRIDYASFERDGHHPFASIQDQGGCALMERTLDAPGS